MTSTSNDEYFQRLRDQREMNKMRSRQIKWKNEEPPAQFKWKQNAGELIVESVTLSNR